MCTAAGGEQEEAEHYIFHKLLHSFPGLLNCRHNFRPNIASHRPVDLQTTCHMSSAMIDCNAGRVHKGGLTGFCNTAVLPLYACETWLALERHTQRREVFPMRCRRFPSGFSWHDHRRNVSVRHSCHLPSIASGTQFRRLRWLGHVARMPDDRLPVRVLSGQLPGGKGLS